MRAINVLLIENSRVNGVSFAQALQRKYQVQIAQSGKQGLSLALAKRPDVIVLDAASLRTSGNRICSTLRASLGGLPIIHIRSADKSMGDTDADVLLIPPFTSRKLINRIERFAEAVEEGELLELGPFSLNMEQQTLTTPWSEKKLTPKLVALMAFFIQRQGETLDRTVIMKEVWKTNYVGDTRTLDVHIRWLRQVVEPSPRKPQYITTVRGIGYCFALPDQNQETKSPELSVPPANT
jgi:DNA-binding response OmpR family regulator